MVIEYAIDRLPRMRKMLASNYAATILHRIAQAFPDRPVAEREAIRRAYLRHRLINRVVHRLMLRLPAVAALVSRAVPVRGREHLERLALYPGPIVLASAHFGPLFLNLMIASRLLSGRRFYVLYKLTSPDAARNVAFLRARGMIPVGNDAAGLRLIARVVARREQSAIAIAFDAQNLGRTYLPFLATTLRVAGGLGFIADLGRCPVVPWFWQYEKGQASVVVSEPHYLDPELPKPQRRAALTAALYQILESRVARDPAQWELDYLPDSAAVTCNTPLEPH